jgi:hypothetical protein
MKPIDKRGIFIYNKGREPKKEEERTRMFAATGRVTVPEHLFCFGAAAAPDRRRF